MPSFPAFSPLSRSLLFALPALLWALLTPVLANDPQSMMEQLDRLDRVELLDLLEKAQICVTSNNFDCADGNLAKAKKFAKSGKNLGDWTRVNGLLNSAKIRVEQQRLARIRAEEDAERERRRLAREEAEEAEREAREERARARREAARLAELELDNDSSQPSTASLILGGINSTLQNYNRYNAQITAQTQTILRQASEARAREAEAERARQRAAAQRQADERNRLNEMRAANDRRQQEATSRAERARLEANAEQQRAQAEQEERKRALLAEQTARNEREQRAAETRQRQEREKAERLAQQQAEKAAAAKQLADFHAGMAQGIRLVATKCPDGEGHYYATGTRPSLKEPSGGSCIDVNFEAICPGNLPPIQGVANNFVGFASCFGDTYKISPKPSCDVKEVRIRVRSVQQCR